MRLQVLVKGWLQAWLLGLKRVRVRVRECVYVCACVCVCVCVFGSEIRLWEQVRVHTRM